LTQHGSTLKRQSIMHCNNTGNDGNAAEQSVHCICGILRFF
jgi:hypothetical protein